MKTQIARAYFCIALIASVFLFINFASGQNIDIVITEIGAYELSGASGHEWLEIYNKGTDPVDIAGWKFFEDCNKPSGICTNHGLTLKQGSDTIIEPGEYAIIAQNDVNFVADYPNVSTTIFDSSWGSLNESGEKIGLKDADKNIVEEFTYISAPNFSLERKDPDSQDYSINNWIEHPSGNTVGEENYWHLWAPPVNNLPVALIQAPTSTEINTPVIFDGSDSTDSDGTIAFYDWDFGDTGVGTGASTTHTYTATGTFPIFLIVTDDQGATDTTSTNISIIDIAQVPSPPPPEPEPEPEPQLTGLVINEFVSDPNAGENEWIEIYNITTSSIDLTGWTLEDGVGQIAAPTSTIAAQGFFVIELAASKLNNAGDIIILKNSNDGIVDQVSFGDWDDGNTSDNASAPEKENTIARVIDGQDSDIDSNDFSETTTPTKNTTNQITTPTVPETDPPPSSGGGGGGEPSPTYNAGDVVINELVSDPSGAGEEFVELYNTTNNLITLDDWYIEEGSESKTTINGQILPKGFFVIEKPSGNLNNSGDIVLLYDPSEKEIDRVTYGIWDDGNTSDNAPAAADPLSLARKTDGQDENNDYYDFVLTSTITKNSANIISSIAEDETQIIEEYTGSTNIVINEVLPNPTGSDTEDEFIELKNIGSEMIDLTGWKLGDASKKRYTITGGRIQSNGYIVFKRSTTGIALNNTGGDEIKLFAPNGSLINQTQYTGSAGEDESYARRDDGSWAWTTNPTPGIKNSIEGKHVAPIIALDVDTEVMVGESTLFDASDTTDPEGQFITFVWDFDDGNSDEGDVVEHRFMIEGVYNIKLEATNTNGDTAKSSVVITVVDTTSIFGGYTMLDAAMNVRISEFVPNPVGSDSTEFIELVNPTSEDIDISGLKLDDEEGGSRAYTIPDGSIIPGESYLVFGRQDTKLALNNTGDEVRLIYPDGTIIREVRYDGVPEGAAYIQDENDVWHWTGTLTPGELNVLTPPRAVAGIKILSTKKRSPRIKPTIFTTVERLPYEDLGDRVRVEGVVVVEPGVLGSQYFYIADPGNSTTTLPGVQVYSYKKDFPTLRIGDKIEVIGELSEASGEIRIKTREKSDMKIIEHVGEPAPIKIEIADVGESFEGSFVQIHGEITEIKGSYMYVDDGTGEVKTYFKRGAGINKKLLQLGDLVEVKGIVNQTKAGYQLLPRAQKDILKTGVTEEVVNFMQTQEEDESKEVAEKYLTATAGGLTSILIGLFAKGRGAGTKNVLSKVWLGLIGLFRKKRE